jgi:hypothetical protein
LEGLDSCAAAEAEEEAAVAEEEAVQAEEVGLI